MKKILTAFAVLLAVSSVSACASAPEKPAPQAWHTTTKNVQKPKKTKSVKPAQKKPAPKKQATEAEVMDFFGL